MALGEVADFINGVAFKPSDWHDNGLPIIRIQNLTDPSKPINYTNRTVDGKYKVRRGDLLVSWSATLGVFVWDRTDEALVNQHIFRVVPNTLKIDPAFLRHMLSGALVSMERHLHGATLKHINRAEFLSTLIPVPPLDEQRRIAAILDHANSLASARRIVGTRLEELIINTFHHMFGNLPACHKLMDGCVRITDGTHQTPTWTDSGVPFIFITNITSGEIDFTTKKFISVETWQELTRRTPINIGDVLYSTVGVTYGMPAVVRSAQRFAFQRHIAHIKPNSDVLHPDFLATMLASPLVKRQADRVARGAAQPTVNLSDIRDFDVVIPPFKLQQQFVSRVAAIRDSRAQAAAALEAHLGLFDGLRARALSGQL